MSMTTEIKKKAVLQALEQTLGVVTAACQQAGVGRTQYYQWLKEDPEFLQDVKDLKNVAKDFVESQLFKQIKDGNTSATIFYLKTQAKDRGYVERMEHLDLTESPVFPDITPEDEIDLTEEE